MRLIEHYLSIQGEALRAGQLTYFVRFARCNLRCNWCDSTYSFGAGKTVSLARLKRAIKTAGVEYVCLTGGEPLLHLADCQKIMASLPQLYFDIETSGSLDILPVQQKNSSIILDWKLSGSGMTHKMRRKNLDLLRPSQDCVKLVTDGSNAEKKEILAFIKQTQKQDLAILLQPVHGSALTDLADWVVQLKNKRVRLSLQLHKYLWPQRQKGI